MRRAIKQANKFTEGDSKLLHRLGAGGLSQGMLLLNHESRGRMQKLPGESLWLALRGRSGYTIVGVPSGPKIYESIDALRLKKQQLLLCST